MNNNKFQVFCIVCFAPRKWHCLLEHLSKNKNIILLNNVYAGMFNTSRWEITSWFSDPLRILSNDAAVTVLGLDVNKPYTPEELFSIFLNFVQANLYANGVFCFGEGFVFNSHPISSSFFTEIKRISNLSVMFFIDNVFNDVKFKTLKRIEWAKTSEEIKNNNDEQYGQP